MNAPSMRPLAVLLAALSLPACGGGGKGGIPFLPPVPGTSRVSVTSAGAQATGGESRNPAISSDGRFIAFESFSGTLVAGDTNSSADVFVHDTSTGETTRVSVDSAGAEGNGHSTVSAISGDGRFVAFVSSATNLVAGDTNGVADVLVHDRQTGATTRVSVDSAGAQGDALSTFPTLSSSGRFVAFQSDATNLVAGDTNASTDIFVHDRQTGATIRASVDSAEAQSSGGGSEARISADGTVVVFLSFAIDLVAGDVNGFQDVFVRDLSAGTTTLASVTSLGAQTNGNSFMGAVSANGRFVVFNTVATNLAAGDTNGAADVFLHDRTIGTTTLISVTSLGVQGNSDSGVRSISGDGRYVLFDSEATNLVPGDTNGEPDVFLRDTTAGTTALVSVPSAGGLGDDTSGSQVISEDGRYAAFSSYATNLVPGDTNAVGDVFRRGPLY